MTKRKDYKISSYGQTIGGGWVASSLIKTGKEENWLINKQKGTKLFIIVFQMVELIELKLFLTFAKVNFLITTSHALSA